MSLHYNTDVELRKIKNKISERQISEDFFLVEWLSTSFDQRVSQLLKDLDKIFW